MDGLTTILAVAASLGGFATGSGTAWQIGLVTVMLSVCLLLAILNSIADPTFLWVLLPIVLAVDFLSGFVHWFFDTQVKPSKSFFGRIAIDFLDHHVRSERTADTLQPGF